MRKIVMIIVEILETINEEIKSVLHDIFIIVYCVFSLACGEWFGLTFMIFALMLLVFLVMLAK